MFESLFQADIRYTCINIVGVSMASHTKVFCGKKSSSQFFSEEREEWRTQWAPGDGWVVCSAVEGARTEREVASVARLLTGSLHTHHKRPNVQHILQTFYHYRYTTLTLQPSLSLQPLSPSIPPPLPLSLSPPRPIALLQTLHHSHLSHLRPDPDLRSL